MGFLLLILVLFSATALVVVVLVRGGRALRLTFAAPLGVLTLVVLGLLLARSTVRSPEMATGGIIQANPKVIMSTAVDGGVYRDVSEFQVATSNTSRAPAGDRRQDGAVQIRQVPERPDEPTVPAGAPVQPQPADVEAPGPAHPPDPQAAAAGTEPVFAEHWVRMLNEQSLDQDPHVSTESLIKFMTERVVAAVQNVTGEGGLPRVTSEPSVPRELVGSISQQIHAWDGPPPEGRANGETLVRLKWNGRTERRMTWWPTPMTRGTLEAHVAGPKGTAVVAAKLDEKPWLFAMPSSGYVVALSGEPQGSAGQAINSARHAADRLLYPKVRRALLGISPRDWDADQAIEDATAWQRVDGWNVTDTYIRERVRQMAHSDVGVMDHCVVRVRRPYGDVWYAAHLRDASPQPARVVAREAVNVSNDRRQTFAGMIAGLGGMVLVLGLLYLALNALTRGYFRGRLRTATVVAALGIGAALLVLMA